MQICEAEGRCADPARLRKLIADQWQDATVYLYLARQTDEKDGALLRELSRQAQAHAVCLKGIYTLHTGIPFCPRAEPPEEGSIRELLRRCYGTKMRSLALYDAWAASPEYGQVFRHLAEQERAASGKLLAVLERQEKA